MWGKGIVTREGLTRPGYCKFGKTRCIYHYKAVSMRRKAVYKGRFYGNSSGVNTGTAIIQCCHQWSALLNYNVSTPSCQPILMTYKYSKQDIQLYGSWRGHWHRSRPRIDKCYEEVEMRQNHKKYKARELEKITDNPGVKSDITV